MSKIVISPFFERSGIKDGKFAVMAIDYVSNTAVTTLLISGLIVVLSAQLSTDSPDSSVAFAYEDTFVLNLRSPEVEQQPGQSPEDFVMPDVADSLEVNCLTSLMRNDLVLVRMLVEIEPAVRQVIWNDCQNAIRLGYRAEIEAEQRLALADGPNQQRWVDPTVEGERVLRQEVLWSLLTNLPPTDAAIVKGELSKKVAFEQEANLRCGIAVMDKCLRLSAKQRARLGAMLEENKPTQVAGWEAFCSSRMVFLPNVGESVVQAICRDEQFEAWKTTRRIDVRKRLFEDHHWSSADEHWWTGQSDKANRDHEVSEDFPEPAGPQGTLGPAAIVAQEPMPPLGDDAEEVSPTRLEPYQNDDLNVFGPLFGTRTTDEGFRLLEQDLRLRIDELVELCQISAATKEALLLAGRGDIERFRRELRPVVTLHEFLKANGDPAGIGYEKVDSKVRGELGRKAKMVFDTPASMLHRAIGRLFSEEQLATVRAAELERRRFHWNVVVDSGICQLEKSVSLTSLQRTQLQTLLRNEAPPFVLFGSTRFWYFATKLAELPRDELRVLFDDRQWKIFQEVLDIPPKVRASAMSIEIAGGEQAQVEELEKLTCE